MEQSSSIRRDFPLPCERKITYLHSVDLNPSALSEISAHFFPHHEVHEMSVLSGGIINQTYLIQLSETAFILQKLNSTVFQHPEQVTQNIQLIAEHFEHHHPAVTHLKLIRTATGDIGLTTSDGHFWRAFEEVSDAICFEEVSDSSLAYETGKGFGRFFRQLKGIDTAQIFDSIPDFHHTPRRFQAFQNALKKDAHRRASVAQPEIDFLLNSTPPLDLVTLGLQNKEIPTRLCHNDTKISNILFDKKSREAKCVIDLDTIMTGSLLYDFGDLVRTTFSSESTPQTASLDLDLELFQALAKGFLEQTSELLSRRERELLVYSSQLITAELALRFLTDFLEGDSYFTVDSELQNLERTRTQIHLLKALYLKETEMQNIISQL